MNTRISEPITNNYVIDATGQGQRAMKETDEELEKIIKEDITNYWNCVNHITVQVSSEELQESTHLIIRLYLKTFKCSHPQQMLGIINNYLKHTFLL